MTFVSTVIIWLIDTTYSSVLAFVLLKLLQVLLRSELKRYKTKKKTLALDLEFLSLSRQMDQEGLTDDCDTAQGEKKGKRLSEWQLCDWKLNVGNKLMGVAEGQMRTHTHTVSTWCNKATTWPEGMAPVWTPSHRQVQTCGDAWDTEGWRAQLKKKRGRWWRASFPHAWNIAFYTPSSSFFPR